MPNYLQIEGHLSEGELEERYRSAKGGIERGHFQVIWLLSQGKRSQEVAEVTGYHVKRVRQLARRYNREGPQGLGDQRQHNPGRKRLLTQQQESELQAEVEAAFTAGQAYTGVDVARRMSEILGQPVIRQRGYELLKRWKHQLKVPRRQHIKQDPKAVDLFKNAPTRDQSAVAEAAPTRVMDNGRTSCGSQTYREKSMDTARFATYGEG